MHIIEKTIQVGHWQRSDIDGIKFLVPCFQSCALCNFFTAMPLFWTHIFFCLVDCNSHLAGFSSLVSSMLKKLTPPWHQRSSLNIDLTISFLWINLYMFLMAFRTKSRLLSISHEPLQDLPPFQLYPPPCASHLLNSHCSPTRLNYL